MRRARRIFLVFLWPLLFANHWGVRGQDGAIKVKVRQVYMPVLAYDHGQALTLSAKNCRVFEGLEQDKKMIWVEQSVDGFIQYDKQPLAVALVDDSTGSMKTVLSDQAVLQGNKLEQAKNASKLFIQSIFRPGQDQAMVSEFFYEIGFVDSQNPKILAIAPSHTHREFFYRNTYYRFLTLSKDKRWILASTSLRVNQPWTGDLDLLKVAIEKIDNAFGATPLRDALFSLTKEMDKAPSDMVRVAIVLSDGLDIPNANAHSLAETIRELQNHQVLVYGVGFYDRSFGAGLPNLPDVLEKTAEATGGFAFFESDPARMMENFFRIGETIRHVNFLSYIPKGREPGERKIKIEVGEWDATGQWHKKNVAVFHRQAYTYQN